MTHGASVGQDAGVLRLIKFIRCTDCVAMLRDLLEKAIAGKVRGVALCYRPDEGPDRVLLTGVFRANAEAAMIAGVRIKREAALQLELFEPGDEP